jgi:hypothetical protein
MHLSKIDSFSDRAKASLVPRCREAISVRLGVPLQRVTHWPPCLQADSIMGEDNGDPQRTSWALLKRNYSNPNLSDERVLNEV